MRAEWTPAVVRAVESARDWARKQNATKPGPAHLVLGLLDECEGRVATLFLAHGLAPDDARSYLLSTPECTREIDPAPLLEYAAELAIERGDDASLRTEHLLLAILRSEDEIRQHLTHAGLDVAAIETRLSSEQNVHLRLEEPLDLSDAGQEMLTSRILDAAANRAREALRAIEDYCRFALNDAFLCREVKTLRHDLAAALENVLDRTLLLARDTLADVGTGISTQRESARHSLQHVAQVNLKRLQEALRSLEEYGKLIRPALGATLEKLRYRTYTLEPAVLLRTDVARRLADARLYLLVTGAQCATSLQFLIEEAAAGGVDMIQLREKELSDRELLDRAGKVRRFTKQAGVLFIINDRADIARLVQADGVHLGQDDIPVQEARRILGADAVIGVSTHNLEQLHQAIRRGASYVGVGPVFPSKTKQFAEYPGPAFVQAATANTSLPAFALGGITAENLAEVVSAGATRAAVSSAICQANEPRAAAMALRRLLKGSS